MFTKLELLLLVSGWIEICYCQLTTGSPLVIAPSGKWDGADGPWSTFNLGVGDPVQSFRCLPGISFPAVVLPMQSEWCNETCEAQTTIFRSDQSRTWKDAGLLEVPRAPSDYSNWSATSNEASLWGVDNVYLGPSVADSRSSLQYIIGSTWSRFYTGAFGLSPGKLGIGGKEKATFLQGLREANIIPSLAFSYTAGSARRNTTGSLVLGGYDTSRFNPATTLSWPMPNKQNSTLVAEITAIVIANRNTSNSSEESFWESRPNSSSSVPVVIDSAVPQIWLPLEACRVFEAVFGLQWDDDAELYLMDHRQRTRLLDENPEVHFTLSSEKKTLNYTLPYSAFDLTIKFPFVNTSSYYFPLKRTTGTPLVLGRTFLQEIYVTVDYGRNNFSLSQAYPDGGSAYIVPISPPASSISNPAQGSGKLSTAAYAGIGVGAGIAFLIASSALVSWASHRSIARKQNLEARDQIYKAELPVSHELRVEAMGQERNELDASERKFEMMCKERSELQGEECAREMEASHAPEVLKIDGIESMHELSGSEITTTAHE